MGFVVAHFLFFFFGLGEASGALIFLMADATLDHAILEVILVLLSLFGPILKEVS